MFGLVWIHLCSENLKYLYKRVKKPAFCGGSDWTYNNIHVVKDTFAKYINSLKKKKDIKTILGLVHGIY